MAAATVFKYRDGVVPTLLAIGYASAGHAAAIALLCADPWTARAAGVLLAAHTLVVATYLVHECIHESIFRDRRWNARLGAALAWLAGGAPAGYERLRRKHLHHHVDRVDPLAFDYRAWLAAHAAARRAVVALEWLHVPALELLLRLVPIARGLGRGAPGAERRRVAAVLASRALAAAALAVLAPPAFALYAVAYLLFVVAARGADAFHHTYDVVLVDDYDLDFGPPPGKDRAYEQAHTASNLLSRRWPALNLLVLNFAYHNAHHAKPGVPWHRLPGLDAQLFAPGAPHRVPLRRLLADFHACRLARLGGAGVAPRPRADGTPRRVGAAGVSLLTI
jgi:fatty acid desaturase